MNPANFNPNDPAGRETFQATQRQQEDGQNEFEQHLLPEARRADAAPPAATVPAPRDRNYPHLSDEDRSLIDAAIKAQFAGRDLNEITPKGYTSALRRLGNHLGSQGKTLSALDHESLVAHAKSFFSHDAVTVPALTVLRRHRDPNAPADGRLRIEPSAEDKNLIERVIQAAAAGRGWQPNTAEQYGRKLRRLAKSLGPDQTITALDHKALVAHVASAGYRDNEAMGLALSLLLEYGEPGTSADRGPPHHNASVAPAAAGVPGPPDPNYPHLSSEDRSLIEAAIKTEATRTGRDLKASSFSSYRAALRRLGNTLGSQGKTLSELDHASLIAHARSSFPGEAGMVPALTMLRRHREPGALGDGQYEPSVEDKNLIEQVVQATADRRGWAPSTANQNRVFLRRLAKSLGPGQTITALDDKALAAHVAKSFGGRQKGDMGTALKMLREYREPGLADGGPPHPSASGKDGRQSGDAGGARRVGRQARPAANPDELEQPLNEQRARSPESFNSTELWERADQAGPLPADSWGTENFWQGLQTPPYSPAGVVDQPGPAVSSTMPAANPREVRRGADQPEQLRPAKRQRTPSDAQGYAIWGPLSEAGNSSGRVLQASIQQLGSSREAQPPHVGGSEAILGASTLQPGHSTTVCVGGDRRPLYSEDASLIDGVRAALVARGNKDAGVTLHVNCLLDFSRWLLQKAKQGIAPRLHDRSLDDDVHELQISGGFGSSTIVPALEFLRTCQAHEALPTRRRAVTPYPDDAALIKKYKSAPGSGISSKTATVYGSVLGSFSHYLRENNRPGIAGRLHDDKSLDEDVERYRGTNKNIGMAMAHLRKSLPRGEGLQAGVMPAGARKPPLHPASVAVPFGHRPGGAPLPSSRSENLMPQPWGRAMGPAGAVPTQAMAAGASNNVRLLNRLASMSVGRPTASPATQNIYRGLETLVELPHTRPAAPPATSDIYGGLESFVDLPSTPQVRRPAAPQATSDIYGDLESFVELPSTPQVRRPAASQATSDIYGDLESFVELPSTPQVRRPAAPQVPLDIYGGPKSVIEIPSTPQELRDDAQSAPVPARSGAQAGAVAPTPRLHHSVPELGAVDWLSDEHITTDFLILRHELWASNPALAARMRFVDPLVAQMLRAGPLGDAERHFQAIVRGQADNDTADFLFLPVNDANAAEADSGNHWSLLLVDRRDRARPVAYHYDSIRGLHDVFAQQLAQRFGAPLEQPGMAQQPNSYDCGVYLVEGARELVRRLAQRQTPAVLNLDNLVVDRAAVQNRLRH